MAINNNSKNYNNEMDKNTKSQQLYNQDCSYPSTLVMGFWNGAATIKIHPALPESTRSYKKIYDYNAFIMSVLNYESIITLLDIINKFYDGTFKGSVGTQTGSTYVELSQKPCNGSNVEEGAIYLNIYGHIDDKGKAGECLSFQFNKKEFFTDFGTTEIKQHKTDTGFMTFIKFLENAANALINAHAHSVRNSNKYDDEKIKNNLTKVMSKLGINIEQNNGGGNGGYFGNIGNNNTQSNEGYDYSYTTTNASGESLPFDEGSEDMPF